MHASFTADPKRLFEVRRYVSERANQESLAREIASDIVLAVSEICSNVFMNTGSDRIDVQINLVDDHLDIEVTTPGVFRPNFEGLARRGAGWGLPLVMATMDQVTIKAGTEADPGTVVRLTKHIG